MNNMVIVQKKPNTFGIQIISKHVVWKTIECQLGAILVRLIVKYYTGSNIFLQSMFVKSVESA